MELLIGRDSASSRLSITIDGKKRAMYGENGSVPNNVSREHCRVSIANNTYRISNANPNNTTYVNGNQVEQKNFNPQSDTITLGHSRYELNITDILKALMPQASKPPQQKAEVKTFSITHLKDIWDTNHEDKLNFQIKERKTNSLRSVTGIISSLSIVATIVTDNENIRICLISVGIVVGVYFAIVSYKASSASVLFMDNLDKKFRKKYICPNPDCHSFLSYNLPYDELIKRGACPYCKSKYTDK